MKTFTMMRLQWASWRLAKSELRFHEAVKRKDEDSASRWCKIFNIEDRRWVELFEHIRSTYGYQSIDQVVEYLRNLTVCTIHRFFLRRLPL